MPELPEVEALARFLDLRTRGRRLERVELASFAALKTVTPQLAELLGRPAQSWRRRGKYLCLDLDGLWLVVHLARSGWIRWYDRLPEARARPSRGPLALRVGLSPAESQPGGPGFDLTEAGTEKRLSVWVVGDPAEIGAVANLGIDPLDPAFDSTRLGRLLAGAPGTIKAALTNQALLAGVGNAYSDEVLHAARLSPFKPARSLSGADIAALHAALVGLLGTAAERAVGLPAGQLKDTKRAALRVHGRAGSPCPACGDIIREVAFATRSLQYCPTCQTGGRPLADRRLSRLLK
ncbi:MAG: DNA-formamidopyrimidine glycosylase family protein [Candidatus Dormibacteria bacterium]|jgi:formamidopyrimidine-DNA glycosylase